MKTVELSSIQSGLPQGQKLQLVSTAKRSERHREDSNLIDSISKQNLNAAKSIHSNQRSIAGVKVRRQVEIHQHTPLCQVYSQLVKKFGAGQAVWILRCKRTNRFFAQLDEHFDTTRWELFSAGVLQKNQVEEEVHRFTGDYTQ